MTSATTSTPTFTVGDRVVVRDVPGFTVVKVSPKTLTVEDWMGITKRARITEVYKDTPAPARKPRGAAKKAAAVKTPVKKARAKTKPETKTTASGPKVGDVVTLTDSGAKRWTIVKVTARTLWVDAVKGDDAYTISHDLVSKIVKPA